MSLPIALQLFSLREALAADTAGILKQIGEAGYDGIETHDLYGHTAPEFRAMCEAAGLRVVACHSSYESFLPDRIDDTISMMRELGCTCGVIPFLIQDRLPGGKLYDETAENIAAAGRKLRECGMTLAFHNHSVEFEKVDGQLKFDLLMERVGAENLATEIDTGWALVGGVDPAEFVLKYSGRAPVVHLKDLYFETSETAMSTLSDEEKKEKHGFEFRPSCEGLLDVPSILNASEKAGALCVIVEQDTPSGGMTALECAVRSISNLKKL